MSEYQALKLRAVELQRKKEEMIKQELVAKQARDKQLAREEEERRRRIEATSKEARRRELMRANEELNRKASGTDGKASREDYDPFAEDIRPKVQPSVTKASAKSSLSKSAKDKSATFSKPRASSHPAKYDPSRLKASSKSLSPPPMLGRKEKAARLFAQKAKKSASESLFSVRALVESRELPPINMRSGPSSSTSITKSGIRDKEVFPSKRSGKGSTIGGMLKSSEKDELRRPGLDGERRDRRRNDQVTNDAKTKRLRESHPSLPSSNNKHHMPSLSRRRRSISDSMDTDSDSSSSLSHKRQRKSPPIHLSEHTSQSAISAEIQALFRRPGRPGPKYMDEFSDGSSDMEAGLSDVEVEERRAARIARLEDEAAEREEREHRAKKEARKKLMMKGGKD
ncbi:uncharacterized protein L203_103471 [Cryptococcus depauperatus CBS 7841]|uniref:Uncharacterized protein n=1 Tax=Cryptococcus depauperatus CBS 7841 TaxID=1295531 RepID=A0A1E3II97_9TREE|nr:hypothetical protein L203_02932 [Cryptococcus depauperatus CBS 7841]